MKTDKIDEQIIREINNYFSYFKNESSWLKLKKYILKSVNSDLRKKFSKRHHNTKKQILNQFEKDIIEYCKINFNVILELKEDEKHSNTKKPIWER